MCFLTVGAFSEVLIWSDKADTAVNTTAVLDGFESGQEFDVFLDCFQSAVAGVWVNLWKLVEGSVCNMVLHFEGILSKKR